MLRKFKKTPYRILFFAFAAIILIWGGFAYSKHRSRAQNPIIPSSDPTNAAVAQNSNSLKNSSSSGSTNPASNSTKVPATTPSTGSSLLISPFGNFVSNHHPGGTAPTTEASVCNTSAGAVCYISFTNGGNTKKLSSQTTGNNGATYWYWDVKDAGLSQGTWIITAIASLNGQTKTATDSQPLVVE